jgi:RNA polymerase sigma-70 factor (ECF subfamily)
VALAVQYFVNGKSKGGIGTLVGEITVHTKLANRPDEREQALPAPTFLAEQDDAALAAAAESGGNEGFEVLVRRHQARLLRVAWRFTRNREDAEDITQQALQKAFVHLRQFEGNSSFSTWLTRIAMNEALMWLRRNRRLSDVPLEKQDVTSETALALDPPDSGLNPEESCLQLERKRIVVAAIHKLTPTRRTAMELRELRELSTQETAGILGLSVGTVKARLFHGRGKLRAMLNGIPDLRGRMENRDCGRVAR